MLLASALVSALAVFTATVRAVQTPLYKAEKQYSILDEAFEDWLKGILDEWGSKGLAIAVVKQEKDGKWIVENKGYGIKDSDGKPVTENTLFSICSNSKLFASLALGKLIESGQYNVDWSTKIADLLPEEWRLQDRVAEKQANLLDILSHRTGLPRHDLAWKLGQSPADAISSLRHLRPSAEFRETFQYNNYMYMAAALVVEKLAGTSYVKFVDDYIISPLGLSSTTFNDTAAELTGELAEGFSLLKTNVSDGDGWTKSVHRATPFFLTPEVRPLIAGAGGVISSAKDIATWLQTLLLEGRHPSTNASVIPAAAIRQAATGISVMNGRASNPELSPRVYGAGQWIYTYQGREVVEHNGGWSGWRSVITRIPGDNLGVAILTNWDEGGYLLDTIKYYLFEKALGLQAVDWNARARAALQATIEHREKSITPPNPHQPPSLEISRVAGVYDNPAYGQIELCDARKGSKPASSGCADLVARYQQQLQSEGRAYSSLIAHLPSVASNHLELTHFSRDSFNVSFGYFVSESSSNDKNARGPGFIVPLSESEAPTAEFVVDTTSFTITGFALFGVWGAGLGVPPPSGRSVKERAEVWFDRVLA